MTSFAAPHFAVPHATGPGHVSGRAMPSDGAVRCRADLVWRCSRAAARTPLRCGVRPGCEPMAGVRARSHPHRRSAPTRWPAPGPLRA